MGRFAFSKTAGAVALVLAGLSTAAYAESDPVLKQADQLMAQHQAKAAFELLAPLEDERAGQADYDYLLGLSALESGNTAQAAFAFERCLTVEPRNGPCRVQMARTHLALGENKSARRELDTIQQYNPPPEVAKMVAAYLGDLSKAEKKEKQQVNAYADVGAGYDSNANSATGQSQIALPGIFGGFMGSLSPNAVKQSSGFAQALAGVNGQYAINPRWSLLADADVNGRSYPNHGDFKYLYGDLDAGAAYHDGASQYSGKVQTQAYDMNSALFRRMWGATLQYGYSYSASTQVTAYLQSNRLSYPGNAPFNATRNTAGSALSTGLSMPYSPVVFVGPYFGSEIARDGSYTYNSQHFAGLRSGGTLFLNEQLSVNSTVALERRVFDDFNFIFGNEARHDVQFDFSLGASYLLQKGLSLRPNYSYTRSNSNIVVNKFGRNVISLDLRYEM